VTRLCSRFWRKPCIEKLLAAKEMTARLPPPVPQVPVRDLRRAISFYQSRLGFALDWKYGDDLAGASREEARLFLARIDGGPLHPIRIWLNLGSTSEVDLLYSEWRKSGVPIVSAPEQKSWGIYEFIAKDCDGNSYRVFYDTETPKQKG
jgi:catechol 2,3-dioxygenase-like lactoylglutathione lyase family enzyme